MSMKVRALRQTDKLLAVAEIYQASWRVAYRGLIPQTYLDGLQADRWVKALQDPARHQLLLLDEQTPIGTCAYGAARFEEMAGGGELIALYLLPEAWGRGGGRLLLERAAAGLLAMGLGDIFLWVLGENHPARRFYERCGFAPTGAVRTDEIGGRPLQELCYHRRAEL